MRSPKCRAKCRARRRLTSEGRQMQRSKNKKRNTRRRLSRLLCSKFEQLINKEFVLEFIDELENWTFQAGEFKNFKKRVLGFDDEQWEIVVNQHNVNVNVNFKRKTDEGDDEFLKYHNVELLGSRVSTLVVTRWDDDCFEAKVYLTRGYNLFEGSVKEIKRII